jgi:hypothetical protein
VLKTNVFHTGVCVESVLAKRKQRNGSVERRFRHLGFVHLSQVQDPCWFLKWSSKLKVQGTRVMLRDSVWKWCVPRSLTRRRILGHWLKTKLIKHNALAGNACDATWLCMKAVWALFFDRRRTLRHWLKNESVKQLEHQMLSAGQISCDDMKHMSKTRIWWCVVCCKCELSLSKHKEAVGLLIRKDCTAQRPTLHNVTD